VKWNLPESFYISECAQRSNWIFKRGVDLHKVYVYTVYIKYRRLDMKRLNLNMGDELNSRMEREALRAEMTISELIRRAVEEYLDRRKGG